MLYLYFSFNIFNWQIDSITEHIIVMYGEMCML